MANCLQNVTPAANANALVLTPEQKILFDQLPESVKKVLSKFLLLFILLLLSDWFDSDCYARSFQTMAGRTTTFESNARTVC